MARSSERGFINGLQQVAHRQNRPGNAGCALLRPRNSGRPGRQVPLPRGAVPDLPGAAPRGRLQPLLLAVERARDRRPAQGHGETGRGRQGLQLVPRRAEGRPHARGAAAGRPLRAGRGRRAPAAVRRRQRHHADDVADQVGAEGRPAPHPPCSTPTATSPRSSSTPSWSRCSPQPRQPAGGDPSSRCRAGPHPAARDHRGAEGLRGRRGLSLRARAVHDPGRAHAAGRRHAARESAPRALRGVGQRCRAGRARRRRRDPERDHHPFRGQGAQGAVPQGPQPFSRRRAPPASTRCRRARKASAPRARPSASRARSCWRRTTSTRPTISPTTGS